MAKLVAQILLMFFLESSLSVAEQSCGGVLTNISGVITSPNYPNNYPDSTTCTWKIAPEKSHVNLTIADLMLEDSQTCQEFDFVKIRAKVGYSFSEVALCGTMASRQISLKVEGTAIEITFKSDDMFNERGFKISYRAYDVDPCLEKNGGCSHMCNLEKGTRVCSCSNGYKLMYDKRTCKGENSCYFVGRKKCPSGTRTTCKDRPNGTTTCECWYGYKRERDAGPCQDIDECREKPGRCGLGTCRNGRGWFTCNCPKGYYYNGNTCVDANECGYKNCGDAKCVNTHGSYICQCRPGYQFNDDLLACEDINECDTTSSACDHVCNNTEGSYNCSCRPGYFLDSDGSTCRAARVEGLGQVRRSETCQGTSLVISCKNDQKALIIHKATYGRGDLTLCPYRQEQGLLEEDTDDSSLCEEDITDKIKGLCGWRKICNITVSSETLGAVCPGVYKHLSVQYSCGKPLMCQSLPPSHSCAAVETNDCTSDESCQSSQMCCFDGCKRTCSVPSLYTADI